MKRLLAIALPLGALLAATAAAEPGAAAWPQLIAAPQSTFSGEPTGVEVIGDRLFVSTRYTIAAFDVSDPNAVELLSVSQTSESTQRMMVSGEHAFLVGYHEDLSIHDVSAPQNGLPLIGDDKIDGGASMTGVGVEGDRVFVSGHGTGFAHL